MLCDINKHLSACSRTTQPFVRRATTGATALTSTTRGAQSSPSLNGLLLIKTSSSPRPDPGAGTTPTWYTFLFEVNFNMEPRKPINNLNPNASCFILKMECSFISKLEVHRYSRELICCFSERKMRFRILHSGWACIYTNYIKPLLYLVFINSVPWIPACFDIGYVFMIMVSFPSSWLGTLAWVMTSRSLRWHYGPLWQPLCSCLMIWGTFVLAPRSCCRTGTS